MTTAKSAVAAASQVAVVTANGTAAGAKTTVGTGHTGDSVAVADTLREAVHERDPDTDTDAVTDGVADADGTGADRDDGDGDGDALSPPPQLYSTDVDVDELPDPPVSKRVVRRSTPDVDTPPPGTFSRPVSVVPPVPDDAASHRRGNTVVSRYLNCAPDATCAPFSVTLYDPGVVPMQQMPSP
jgi:hypothetical protein